MLSVFMPLAHFGASLPEFRPTMETYMKRPSSESALRAFLLVTAASICLGLAAVWAEMAMGQGNPPAQGRKGPPPEAFAACVNLSEQDSCDITTPEGKEITGVCMLMPDEKMACMPADAPAPPSN